MTKYLTKAVSIGERGTREVQRERVALVRDEQGRLQLGTDTITEQVTSKAHRIRYSRKFFPESVAELRMRLFAGLEGAEDGKPFEQNEENEETKSGHPGYLWTIGQAHRRKLSTINNVDLLRCS